MRNEAEDQLFVIAGLQRGHRFGFIDAVHVEYRVHDSNSSAAGSVNDADRQHRVLQLLASGYERMLAETNWRGKERAALRRRVMEVYFWKLGYATLWQRGRRDEAVRMFRRGIRVWPWDWRCWKTLVVAESKILFSPQTRRMPSADGKPAS